MKILFLTTNFPRWEGDVHSPWAVELIHRLEKRGVIVTVCAPAYGGQGDHQIEGIPVVRYRYAPAAWETLTHESGAPNKIRANPLYLALLPAYLAAGIACVRRLSQKVTWDAIHVHWPVPQGFIALAGAGKAGGRLICTFYGADLALARKKPLALFALRHIVRHSDALTAISRHTAGLLEELCGVSPRVIPYGSDMSPRTMPHQDTGGWPFRILTVGRLIERKGHGVLIDAIGELRRRGRQVALTMVGEGPFRDRLEAQITQQGLGGVVEMAGLVSDEALENAYAGCDAFVLPAIIDSTGDTEGLGMVLLEALRYEKPVIASGIGGIVDIIEDGVSGLLVPPSRPAALAEAIKRLMDDPPLANRLGREGRQINAKRFDWDHIVEEYMSLYGGD